MLPIDAIKIHFEPGQLGLLNVILGAIMFGIALEIDLRGFKQLLHQPKAAILGLLAQYLIFPLFTLALVWLLRPPASVALGMALIAACPSGNIANYATHLARANVPLSITLGAVITLCAWFSTPAVFAILSSYMPPDTAALAQSFRLSPLDLILKIAQLIVFPMLLGLSMRRLAPKWVQIITRPVQILSLLLFLAVIVGALYSNFAHLKTQLHHVFWLVLLQNALGLFAGYALGKIGRLSATDSITLAFESGVHNTGLGLLLIFNFFNGLGGMAIIAAWYGIWDMLTVLLLASWWRRKSK